MFNPFKVTAVGYETNTTNPHLFTCSPSLKTFFLKLRRAAYPIHEGHWPSISAWQDDHNRFALCLPCCVCAIFPLGGPNVCHPYLRWPGHSLQGGLMGSLQLTSVEYALKRLVRLDRNLDLKANSALTKEATWDSRSLYKMKDFSINTNPQEVKY